MKYLLLLSALSLSSIAAYFSIVGLSTIFPGSILSIIIMAVALELAKIVVAVWTHQNWKQISKLTKFYLSFSIIVLMAITSGGIFGFLSKSHIEHSSSVSFAENSIKEIDRKIALEEDSIQRQNAFILEKKSVTEFSEVKNQKIIDQLNSDINTIYSRLDIDTKENNNKIDRLQSRLKILDDAVETLRNQKTGLFSSNTKKIQALEDSQKEERVFISSQLKVISDLMVDQKKESSLKVDEIRSKMLSLQNEKVELSEIDLDSIASQEVKIKESLSKIEELNLKKFELKTKNLAVENELGPIKYIGQVIEDLGGPKMDTGSAVRLVIVFIVTVFDPLAIVMVICAASGFSRKEKKVKEPEEPKIEEEKKEVNNIIAEAESPDSTEKKTKEKVLVEKNGYVYYDFKK